MDTICEKKKLQILPVQMIKPARLKEKESCPNKIENHFCIFLLIPIPEKKKKEKKRKKKEKLNVHFRQTCLQGFSGFARREQTQESPRNEVILAQIE